ncbi:hypothetical protein MO973_39005 [Paenibacillus sp. TRM 82003]|nr:hypothetical protein [Paenibacillus sp. TRM 82003]
MKTLQDIYSRFSVELDDVIYTFTTIPPYPGRQITRTGTHRIAREGAVTHTFDAWGRFARNVILLSATRAVTGLSGISYGPAPFPSYSAAKTHLAQNKSAISGFQYGEPQWHLQQAALDALRLLNPSNASKIRAAFGASVSSSATSVSVADPVVALHRVRNFIAHKGMSAASKSDPILQADGARSVMEWLDQAVGGISRFEEIVLNLRVMAKLAVQ